ncbi:hypothetical protein K2173_000830 [Erythroxylum novogranatense]|uniref:Uncharacterized protein n=1 Tax=Erythroxylum novogranatense TaxID=1862640 RepID=A0AAV8S7W8_9ROSI|nr:hypothetical protein K2173_000830 [Erythroxylum novogranatense]
MEAQSQEGIPRVKAVLKLGSEVYSVNAVKGDLISEQLASMKEESMGILKEFITKHNVPIHVPDEDLVESSSEDNDDEISDKSQVKSKKTKLT